MRALVIDNSETNRGTVEHRLGTVGFDVVSCSDLKSALTAIRSGPFNAIFVDDKLGGDGRTERQAKTPVPALRAEALTVPIIVAYSCTKSRETGYREALLALGADDFVDFEDLITGAPGWATLATTRNQMVLSRLVLSPPTDLATRAALERVGGDTLKEVIMSFLGPGTADVKALSAGLSGDPVFRVVFRAASASVHASHNVIKFSRTRWSLSREFEGAPSMAQSFSAVSMQRMTQAAVNGWWAGISPMLRTAPSLEERLLAPRASAHTAKQLARVVWDNVLEEPYNEARDASQPDSQRALTARYVHSVVVSSDHIAQALNGIYRRKALAKTVAALGERVSDREGAIWPYRTDEEGWCHAHGDLHLRNILLLSKVPFVIDWALAGEAPRCNDVSNLVVDAFCTGAYLPLARQWSIQQAEADLRVFQRSLKAKVIISRGLSNPLVFANALLVHLRKTGATDSEIGRALCFHCLRYMRFGSLPMPRRVFAALGAAHFVRMYNL